MEKENIGWKNGHKKAPTWRGFLDSGPVFIRL
jgi:hypothetical protein